MFWRPPQESQSSDTLQGCMGTRCWVESSCSIWCSSCARSTSVGTSASSAWSKRLASTSCRPWTLTDTRWLLKRCLEEHLFPDCVMAPWHNSKHSIGLSSHPQGSELSGWALGRYSHEWIDMNHNFADLNSGMWTAIELETDQSKLINHYFPIPEQYTSEEAFVSFV